MKKLIYIFTLLLTFQVSAQDPMIQTNNQTIEQRAAEITDKYDAEIELDAKQTILFQKKIEQFLIREDKINAEYEGEQKLDMIRKLRKAETLEMMNILSRPQLTLYKKLKPKIQPLGYANEKR